MITIGALFLVIGAVEKSHIVDFLARKAFGMSGSVNIAKARMYCTCFCLSIFFNNTPLVAILLPVVKDWGRVRNVAASQLLIPLSYSVLAGSFGSMIGEYLFLFYHFTQDPFLYHLLSIILMYPRHIIESDDSRLNAGGPQLFLHILRSGAYWFPPVLPDADLPAGSW